MDKIWNEVLVMRFCTVVFSLNLGLNFPVLLKETPMLLGVTILFLLI